MLGCLPHCSGKPILPRNLSRFGYHVLNYQSTILFIFNYVLSTYSMSSIHAVSRFVIFVVAPDWLADGLRYNIAGGVFCLILGFLLVVMEIGGGGICNTWECNLQCLGYYLAISFLFYFTLLYLL